MGLIGVLILSQNSKILVTIDPQLKEFSNKKSAWPAMKRCKIEMKENTFTINYLKL